MRLDLNWIQRLILVLVGALMWLFAANNAESYSNPDFRLATVQFLVGAALFVLAASSGKKPNNA